MQKSTPDSDSDDALERLERETKALKNQSRKLRADIDDLWQTQYNIVNWLTTFGGKLHGYLSVLFFFYSSESISSVKTISALLRRM